MRGYADCQCPIEDRTANYIAASVQKIEPLYAMEQQHGFEDGKAEGAAFVTERLSAGAAELRDMIVDAWRASAAMKVGYPPLSLEDIQSGKVNPRASFVGED